MCPTPAYESRLHDPTTHQSQSWPDGLGGPLRRVSIRRTSGDDRATGSFTVHAGPLGPGGGGVLSSLPRRRRSSPEIFAAQRSSVPRGVCRDDWWMGRAVVCDHGGRGERVGSGYRRDAADGHIDRLSRGLGARLPRLYPWYALDALPSIGAAG